MNGNDMNRVIAKSTIGLLSVLISSFTLTAFAQGPAPSVTSDCTSAAYTLSSGTQTLSNQTYTAAVDSTGTNCAVYTTGSSKLTLSNSTLNSLQTSGGSGAGIETNGTSVAILDNDIINVYGVNGIYATSKDTACYTTDGVAVSSALPCAWVTLKNSTINAVGGNAHGVDAMYMGGIDLYNVTITTTGDSAAGAVVNDTGDGFVNATNVTAHTTGGGSSGIYEIGSESIFNIKNSTFVADASDGAAVVVGGTLNLTNTSITGYKEGLLLDGTATINGGVIKGTATGTLTGNSYASSNPYTYPGGNAVNIMPFGAPAMVPATLNLKNGAKLIPRTGAYLIYATSEETTNCTTTCLVAVVNATKEVLAGDIYLVDDGISTLAVNLSYSTLKGAVTNAAVSLDAHSKWTVTGDSAVTTLSIPGSSTTSLFNEVVSTGDYTITYDSSATANDWLGGLTYILTGGATLQPK